MRVPVEWLNSYLEKPLSPSAAAEALELAGIEVEAIEGALQLDPGVVVGSVREVNPHPAADKLRVAKVDVGDQELTIVCGAPNLKAGQGVAVALVGSKLPDGTKLKAANLRGVESQGMICSPRELELGEDHSGILVLDQGAPIGRPVQEVIDGNDVIDTTTAANRWDLNGMVWLAREVAAHKDQTVTIQSSEPKNVVKWPAGPAVNNEAPELVPRYMMAQLKVDPKRATPDWLRWRLEAGGIRSISLIVDVTNYVMLESAQPLHAFDAANVELPISVRLATAGEQLTTLDGRTRKLDAADLVIADARGPLGLAGVMGGQHSEVSNDTREIYLEAASFDGPSVRKTAQRHGLRSDASARFERRVPLESPPLALARAIQLLVDEAGAELVGVSDTVPKQAELHPVKTTAAQINSLLGLSLSHKEISHHLTKLDFAVKTQDDDLTITPPWWRPDIAEPADIAEEVIKLVGYDQLPATLPAWEPRQINFDNTWQPRWQAKETLRSLGLFEVVTYSFISQKQITELGRDPQAFLQLKNPLSQEQAYLRTDLLPSLLQVAVRNRAYAKQFGLFEFSKVFQRKDADELPAEPLRLGMLAVSSDRGYQSAKAAADRLARVANVPLTIEPITDETRAEPGLAHPTRAGFIVVAGRRIGWIGELHPLLVQKAKLSGQVGYWELDWEQFAAASQPIGYRAPSRYPAVVRDLSLVVDRTVTWQQLSAALAEQDAAFLSDYYGSDLSADQKVVAVRLTFSASDHTLTDAEADHRADSVLERLHRTFGAELRT